MSDKYKHSFINCEASQYGQGGFDVAEGLSNAKEWYDKMSGANSLDSSNADQYANRTGRLLGTKYQNGSCDEYIQKYIQKKP